MDKELVLEWMGERIAALLCWFTHPKDMSEFEDSVTIKIGGYGSVDNLEAFTFAPTDGQNLFIRPNNEVLQWGTTDGVTTTFTQDNTNQFTINATNLLVGAAAVGAIGLFGAYAGTRLTGNA